MKLIKIEDMTTIDLCREASRQKSRQNTYRDEIERRSMSPLPAQMLAAMVSEAQRIAYRPWARQTISKRDLTFED